MFDLPDESYFRRYSAHALTVFDLPNWWDDRRCSTTFHFSRELPKMSEVSEGHEKRSDD